MYINEQEQFNKEFNELMDKYRIVCFYGIYRSVEGEGEQMGITGMQDGTDLSSRTASQIMPGLIRIFNKLT